jgi:radical SAM superfamily enzyme YgiQ (UPF0313 family)
MSQRLLLVSVGRLAQYSTSTAGGKGFVPRLSLACVAAVTPPEWDVRIISDVHKDEVPANPDADVVGMSVLTPFANASYELADAYRAQGVKVILGGHHLSQLPEEGLPHADAVVVGEAEVVWPKVLDDVMKGRSRGVYRGDTPVDLNTVPPPRVDLFDRSHYGSVALVNVERGCPFSCQWCLTPGREGKKYRYKAPDRTVAEIRGLQERLGIDYFSLTDCSVNNRPWIRQFAPQVKELGLKWTGSGVIEALLNRETLELVADAGCDCIYLETEPISKTRQPETYRKIIESIRAARRLGVKIHYNFTFGYDDHEPALFQETVEFVEKAEMELVIFQIYTPWPATPQFRQLEAENRLLTTNWDRYDNASAVHRPLLMTPKQLEDGVARLYEQFYSGSYFDAIPLQNLNTLKQFVSFFV